MERAFASGQVAEVYFASGPMDGRVWNFFGGGKQPPEDATVEQARQLVDLCHRNGVLANLLCNAPTLYFARRDSLFASIRAIAPDALPLSDPMALGAFREAFPEADLQASLIMNLDSREKIRQALQRGVGTITLPGRFNRDVRALAEVNELKAEFPRFRIKLIANMDCAYDCFLLPNHYMLGVFEGLLSGRTSGTRTHGVYGCESCYNPPRAPEDFIRVPFIRPEDVDFYDQLGCVDALKLIYRSHPTPVLERIFRAYFERRHDGDLFDLIEEKRSCKGGPDRMRCDNTRFPAGFAPTVARCDKRCERCDYCRDVAEATRCRVL